MTRRPLAVSTGLAALLVLSALPAAAQPGPQPDVTSTTTYTVRPDAGVVDVVAKTKVVNKVKQKKGATRVGFSGWGPIVIPAEATDLVIKGKKVKAEQTYDDGGTIYYSTTVPPLWPKKKATITTKYMLPSQGPDGAGLTRIEPGYVHVCWPGQPGDRGLVTLEVPIGGPEQYHSGSGSMGLSSTTQAESTAISTDEVGISSSRSRCTELVDPGQLRYTPVEGLEAPVAVRSWSGDADWNDMVVTEATEALPHLFDALSPTGSRAVQANGAIPPEAPGPASLVIDESATQAWPYSTGALWQTDGRMAVREGALPPGAVSVPLARIWLGPESPITAPWLREGFAAWTGYRAIGAACPEVPMFPEYYESVGKDLDDNWTVPGNYGPEWDLWAWQSASACGIVDAAAHLTGPEAMADLINAMANAPAPVGASDFFSEVDRPIGDPPVDIEGIEPPELPTGPGEVSDADLAAFAARLDELGIELS